MNRNLTLKFVSGQLIETIFEHPLARTSIRSIRGKSSGAFLGYGSFQWTSAVQGLSVLALKAIAFRLSSGRFDSILSGQAGSLASSLDYSLTKSPMWISSMFGADSRGEPLLRRFILRTNANLKRPGPVTLRFNEHTLPFDAIRCVVNGTPIETLDQVKELLAGMDTSDASAQQRPLTNAA